MPAEIFIEYAKQNIHDHRFDISRIEGNVNIMKSV